MINDLLTNLTDPQKSLIKSTQISQLNFVGKFTVGDTDIEISSLKQIQIGNSSGVEIMARAWKNGNPLSFGDGTIETERFRIWNPPILVDDPLGTIIRTSIDYKTGKTITRTLREDPIEAVRQTLAHTIKVSSKNTPPTPGTIGSTTDTFYPDASPESTSVDGRTFRNPAPSETWGTISTGAGISANHVATGPDPASGLDSDDINHNGKYTYLARGIYLFDTSSLPDTDTITSSTFSLFVDSVNTGLGNTTDELVTSNPASNTTLVAADFTTLGTTAQATGLTISTMTTAAYNDWTLNATGKGNISKTGVTKFGTRLGWDIGSGTPTWTDSVSTNVLSYYADATGTTKDPKLVVVHVVGSAVKAQSMKGFSWPI